MRFALSGLKVTLIPKTYSSTGAVIPIQQTTIKIMDLCIMVKMWQTRKQKIVEGVVYPAWGRAGRDRAGHRAGQDPAAPLQMQLISPGHAWG